ncbi:SRPBCC domain-containing protein [Hymenobacter volaticus]|uniref:SRPBCC domain-containing protein n=1 Tax=Hymenobacter volaticus TaxID=2932254 RepID=A0ABY4GEN4_9BACT|nr:SRPBCC domain-containing protein [Hymenobacter volaticus]UOQ69211.1 SRPBCC domain-containing protein [Hymenobacter volaticus]
MEQARFATTIHAPKASVWQVLWDDTLYGIWTRAFSEGSRAITDWQEGSEVQFISADGGGMYSVITKKTPNEFISFQHLGELKDGQKQPVDAKTQSWVGARETYTLTETNGTTELVVEMDVSEAYQDYFTATFPQALAKVKELAENGARG